MARVVFHNSQEVGRQLIAAGLVPAERLVHAPLGVADEFTPHAPALNPLADVELPSGPFLLHVGSQLPRKRIDVLLAVFAGVRKQLPGLRLIQVGPPLALRYVEQVHQLGIEADVQRFSNLQRRQLAELYRRAALVLVPSEAEGFGLPVIEALACGAPVLASAIPVLREVGGEAVLYRPVADIPAWVTAALGVLTDFTFAPARALRLAHASRYSWREHARVIGETYRRLAAFNNRKN
jgi:glycosyltransferase involved in cell wall biosynthesis